MNKLQYKTIKYTVVGCLLLSVQGLSAQNIEKCYVNMPDVLNPTLSKQNRLELLEYHKAGQGDSISNRFGNKAYLLVLDTLNQRVVVKNTVSSTFEMKVLGLADSTLAIGIVRTICGPICQSTVEFYDTAWNPIKLQFTMPKAIEWVNKDRFATENVDRKWVESVLDDSFVSLAFSPDKPELIARNNSLEFLSDIDRKLISPFVFDKAFAYILQGQKWVLRP